MFNKNYDILIQSGHEKTQTYNNEPNPSFSEEFVFQVNKQF